MKINLSKREKVFILIFLITLFWGGINLSKGINNKKESKLDLEIKETVKTSEPIYNNEKDIVLKIENEIKNIVTINSINKNEHSDEYNNKYVSIELHITARIDDIFKVEESLNNIGLEKNIKNIEIVKNTNYTNIEEENIINDYVDCIMSIKVT